MIEPRITVMVRTVLHNLERATTQKQKEGEDMAVLKAGPLKTPSIALASKGQNIITSGILSFFNSIL